MRTAYASEPILVGGSAAVAAIVQWTIVALVFSRLSRVRSARTVGWVAPLVIVFVAVVVQLTIPIVGWKYEPDGP